MRPWMFSLCWKVLQEDLKMHKEKLQLGLSAASAQHQKELQAAKEQFESDIQAVKGHNDAEMKALKVPQSTPAWYMRPCTQPCLHAARLCVSIAPSKAQLECSPVYRHAVACSDMR